MPRVMNDVGLAVIRPQDKRENSCINFQAVDDVYMRFGDISKSANYVLLDLLTPWYCSLTRTNTPVLKKPFNKGGMSSYLKQIAV